MRARRPLLFVVLMLAAISGLLGGTADLLDALRQHAVCPEHGEVLHVESTATQSRPHEIRNAPSDVHDRGCMLATMGALPSPPLVPPPQVSVEIPLLGDVPPAIVASAPAVPSVPLLFEAPKTSPPIRA